MRVQKALVLLAFVAHSSPLLAQRPEPPAISRADLAAAYLRLEQAFFAAPPAPPRLAEVNRGFDRATLAFFTGRNGDALRTIDGLTESLRTAPGSPAEQTAVSLKVSVTPPVWNLRRAVEATVRIVSLYDAPLAEPADTPLQLRLVAPDGQVIIARDLAMRAGPKTTVDQDVQLGSQPSGLSPGLHYLELAAPGGAAVRVGRVNVVDASLAELRAANEGRLAMIEPRSPALSESLAICRARNQLLTDEPSADNSAQFLTDMNSLAASVAAEIDALARNEDPYHRRPGDYWRVMTTDQQAVPLRIYASRAATGDAAVPLLIVLHGAGGDENMFMEGYGAGVVKKIAETKGLLVASPAVYRFGSNPRQVERLIEKLSAHYSIDRQRVYVLGHSMGAGAAAALARGRTAPIAAACCIAGGRSFRSPDGMPPLLVILAQLDAIVPVKSVQTAAEEASANGMPVELRMLEDYGHTLVVGRVLGEAVDWLLTHSTSPSGSAAGGE